MYHWPCDPPVCPAENTICVMDLDGICPAQQDSAMSGPKICHSEEESIKFTCLRTFRDMTETWLSTGVTCAHV